MTKKIYALIVAILLLGGGVFSYFFISTKLELAKCYIAKYDLPSRTCVKEDLLEEVLLPKTYLNENVVTHKEDIIDHFVRVGAYVPRGSLFYKGMLNDKNDMKDGLLYDLRENEVAYDFYASDLRVNQSYLQKGLVVDLYLTINKEEIISDLLLSNARIIGLYDINHHEIKDYDNNTILDTLTLAVNKEDVIFLNKALVLGELNVVANNDPYVFSTSKLNRSSELFSYLK